MDAKRCGGRTLFLAHTQELVNQAADTYQKILAYFHPAFTLGLTATPERTGDNRAILDTPPTSWTSGPPWRLASWYPSVASASTPTST